MEQKDKRFVPHVVAAQVGSTVRFPNLDPIGREVRIQSIPYTVIGVVEKQGSAFGISLDKFLVETESEVAPVEPSTRNIIEPGPVTPYVPVAPAQN